jgi:hypothetical protein
VLSGILRDLDFAVISIRENNFEGIDMNQQSHMREIRMCSGIPEKWLPPCLKSSNLRMMNSTIFDQLPYSAQMASGLQAETMVFSLLNNRSSKTIVEVRDHAASASRKSLEHCGNMN